MRSVLLSIHRWLGLSAGILFCLASFTGGLLAYQQQIDRLMGGSRLDTTEGMVGLARIAGAALDSEPGYEIGRIVWPVGGHNAFRVDLRREAVGLSRFVDGGSGRVLPDPQPSRVGRFLAAAHPNLWIGRTGGRLTYWGTLLGLVGLLIGPLLFQPGLRRFWRGLRVRRGRGAFIASLDLHQFIGLAAFVLLAIMAVTGVLHAHGSFLQRVEGALHGWDVDEAWNSARSMPPADAAPAPPDVDAMARAAVSATGGVPTTLSMPRTADDVVSVNLTRDGNEIVRVKLDRYTGAVLATQVEQRALRINAALNSNLHVGFGVEPLRFAYFLAATAGAFLMPTGLLVWWLRRRRTPAIDPQGRS